MPVAWQIAGTGTSYLELPYLNIFAYMLAGHGFDGVPKAVIPISRGRVTIVRIHLMLYPGKNRFGNDEYLRP